MRQDIADKLIARIGADSPLFAPDAKIIVRVGHQDMLVPVAHLQALIRAEGHDLLAQVAAELSRGQDRSDEVRDQGDR